VLRSKEFQLEEFPSCTFVSFVVKTPFTLQTGEGQ